MKYSRIILTSMAFVAAFASAFTTKTSSRDLFTKVSSDCHLIFCSAVDKDDTGISCGDTNQLYDDPQCTIIHNGPAFVVTKI